MGFKLDLNFWLITSLGGLGVGLMLSFWQGIVPAEWQPRLFYLGLACFAISVVAFCFLFITAKQTIWLPMMKLHPTRENLFPYRRALLIKEAAQKAYDRTHNTGLGMNAVRWAVDKPTGDELSTYAHYFKDLGGYTLYGKRPSSNVYKVVPASQLSSLWFTDDLNGLKHLGGMGTIQYVDVAVTRSDLRKLVKEAKEIDRETIKANMGEKPSPPPQKPEAVQETPPVRDTKMSEALAYVETRKWGKSFFAVIAQPGSVTKAFVPNEMRQAALDKEIKVWGKLSNHGPHTLIDPLYWEVWHIEWFSALKGNCDTEIAEPGYTGGQKYYDLMVSKAEIEKKWPPKYE